MKKHIFYALMILLTIGLQFAQSQSNLVVTGYAKMKNV